MANEIPIHLRLYGEDQVNRGMDSATRSTDKFGDSLQDTAKDAGQLKVKIAETEAEIKKLTKALDETGDLDLLKSIRKEKGKLGALQKLLPKPAEVAEAATEVGTKAGIALSSAMSDALRSSKGMMIPAIVGVVAAAAPGIGAVTAGAILGGVGAGGIIGGIAAASRDVRVQAEAERVGARFLSALTDAGSPFVGPLIESLRILDDAGDRFAKNFAKIGEKLAPVLVPLSKGLAGFADDMMPGLVKAADAMKPVIRAIGNELPKIGREIGNFFETIGEDSDAAVLGIVALSQAVRGTIRTVGELVSALSKVYSSSLDTGIAISGVMESIFGWVPAAGDAITAGRDALLEQRNALNQANDASGDFAGGITGIRRAQEEMAEATKTATEKIEDQITAMDKMFGRAMDPKKLLSDYLQAIDDLTESVKENGRHFDLNSEAGRKNQAQIDEIAESIKNIRNETIEQTGNVHAANTVYYEQVEALRQQAIRLGMSKQEANELAAGLRDIPRQVDVEIRAPGLLESLARARELNRLMGNISSGARARAGDTSGYGGGRAGGGDMEPGMLYTVGERGVELVQMHAGGGATVYSNEQTRAMMSGASGGSMAPAMTSGGVSGVLRYVGPPGATADLAAVLMTMFRVEIAAQGGNVQTVLGGG